MMWQDLVSPKKLEEMRSAMDLVRQWQETTYRVSVLENPDGFFREKERIATVLVDNHLGKLARKVRLIGEGGQGLTSYQFLNDWAELNFILMLWQRFDDLPDGLKLNLLYQSGPNITKKHLDKLRGFTDQFVVLGLTFQMTEQLLQRSVYVYGLRSEQYFLILDFSFNRQPFSQNFTVGEMYKGEAVSYPFPGSLRISVRNWTRDLADSGVYNSIPVPDLGQLAELFRNKLEVNPFCIPFPALLEMQCDLVQGEWVATSTDGHIVRIEMENQSVTEVFRSACFRHTVRFLVLIVENGLQPLSLYNGERFWDLNSLAPEEKGGG